VDGIHLPMFSIIRRRRRKTCATQEGAERRGKSSIFYGEGATAARLRSLHVLKEVVGHRSYNMQGMGELKPGDGIRCRPKPSNLFLLSQSMQGWGGGRKGRERAQGAAKVFKRWTKGPDRTYLDRSGHGEDPKLWSSFPAT